MAAENGSDHNFRGLVDPTKNPQGFRLPMSAAKRIEKSARPHILEIEGCEIRTVDLDSVGDRFRASFTFYFWAAFCGYFAAHLIAWGLRGFAIQ